MRKRRRAASIHDVVRILRGPATWGVYTDESMSVSERGRARTRTVRARDECETDLPGDGSEIGSGWVCTNAAAAAAAAAEEGLLPFYALPPPRRDFYRFTRILYRGTLLPFYAQMTSLLPYPHPMGLALV